MRRRERGRQRERERAKGNEVKEAYLSQILHRVRRLDGSRAIVQWVHEQRCRWYAVEVAAGDGREVDVLAVGGEGEA